MFMSQARRVKARNLALKLASFTANGRTGYGAVVGDGIVDLGKRLAHNKGPKQMELGYLLYFLRFLSSSWSSGATKM